MFGPDNWYSDGSEDEKTYYRYLTTDDHKKIDSIWYCRDADTLTHFQGFVATFVDELDGQRKSLPYGSVNTGTDSCTGFYVRKEINWIIFKRDEDDIEGMIMGTNSDNSIFTFKSEDIEFDDPLDSDVIELPGRLIGFGITTAHVNRGTEEQIVRISAVYNSCNCIASYYYQDMPPESFEVTAGPYGEYTQILGYQANFIEATYTQDCG